MGMFDNIVFDEFTLLDEGKFDGVVKFGTKLKAVTKDTVQKSIPIQKAKLSYDKAKATKNNDHSRDEEFEARKRDIDAAARKREEYKKYKNSEEAKSIEREKKKYRNYNVEESAFSDIKMI